MAVKERMVQHVAAFAAIMGGSSAMDAAADFTLFPHRAEPGAPLDPDRLPSFAQVAGMFGQAR